MDCGEQPLSCREQFLHYGEHFLHYGEDLLYYGEELVDGGEHPLHYKGADQVVPSYPVHLPEGGLHVHDWL